MQIDYRRDIHHNYLILSGDDPPDTASYQVRMLMANQIEGFLPCKVHQIDQKMLFYYDITSRQPLNMLLEHQQIQKDTLELLLSQLAEALENIRNYLLGLNGFLLKPELIYLDASKKQMWFCYYPGNKISFQNQLRELSEYLLPKLDHEDRDAVMMGYVFYQKCVEETMTADVLMELLHRVSTSQPEWETKEAERRLQEEYGEKNIKGPQGKIPETREELLNSFFEPEEKTEKVHLSWKQKVIGVGAVAGLTGILAGLLRAGLPVEGCLLAAAATGICLVCWIVRRNIQEGREQEEEMEKYLQQNWLTGESKNVEEGVRNIQEEEDEKTAYLGLGSLIEKTDEARAWLIPSEPSGGEPVTLERDVCLIGKGKAAADVLLVSPAVSRLHARLTWDGETYCISDLNSKNGTFINDKLLSVGETYALNAGDKIQFADLTYRFQK